MDDDDAGVRKRGGDSGFGEEALLEGLAFLGGDAERELNGFEGDVASERGVVGLVHDAHHAAPQLAANLVASNASRKMCHVSRFLHSALRRDEAPSSRTAPDPPR